MKPQLIEVTAGADQHAVKIGPVQVVVLLLLVVQTTSSCVLVSYSKGILKEKYNPMEAVLCTEVIKFVISGKR
jgi:hypothetical protein